MTRVDDCVLCKIPDGKLPSRKMYEEESFLGLRGSAAGSNSVVGAYPSLMDCGCMKLFMLSKA